MARPRKIPADSDVPALTKRECIVAAAREVFLEMGYAAASMDAVAARANVSKATIYAHFVNKKTLFEWVIQARCQGVFGDLDVPTHSTDARAVLRHLAEQFLAMILAPEAIAIHRVIVAEAGRLPEVGEAFIAAGPVPAISALARLFNDLTRRGLMTVPGDQAPLLADLFLNMLKSKAHTRRLFNVPIENEYIDATIDMAIDLVMARYGAKGGK